MIRIKASDFVRCTLLSSGTLVLGSMSRYFAWKASLALRAEPVIHLCGSASVDHLSGDDLLSRAMILYCHDETTSVQRLPLESINGHHSCREGMGSGCRESMDPCRLYLVFDGTSRRITCTQYSRTATESRVRCPAIDS